MDRIRFERHPAYVTLGDGVGMAADYLRRTWEWWLAPVVGLAIIGGLLSGLGANAATSTDWRSLSRAQALDEFTRLIVPMFGLAALIAVLGLVASWFYAALAIHGLRGRPITADWVLSAGLKSLAGSILLGIVGFGLWFAFVILVFATRGFALIALIGLIPLAIYVGLRLYFWTLAVFDGAGVIEAFRVSWELSRGAVLRMLGWGATFVVLSIVVEIAASIVRAPFLFFPAISAFVGQLITGLFAVFTLYGAAVLYESQRWRNMPPAGAQPPMPGYPGYPAPGGYPGAPGPSGTPGYPPQPGYPAGRAPMSPTPSATPSWAMPPSPSGVPVYPAPGDPLAPPAPPSSAPVPGSPPPLVAWAPVTPQQPPAWTPPPGSGWVPAPGSGWAASPAAPGVPASAAAPEAPEAPAVDTPPPADTLQADESPTEPYAPPPA